MKEPLIAASRSASGRMMFGHLPPSSSVTRLSIRPQVAPILRPTSVEPVKAILSMPGCSTIAAPVSPSPVSDVQHAVGHAGLLGKLAHRSAVSGVCSAGLRMIVQPAARAGAIFQASISSGKFHGMICPQTPTGSLRV